MKQNQVLQLLNRSNVLAVELGALLSLTEGVGLPQSSETMWIAAATAVGLFVGLLTVAALAFRFINRSNAARSLRQQAERYGLAVHGSQQGLWDWNLETDTLYVSPQWKKMLGFEIETDGAAIATQAKEEGWRALLSQPTKSIQQIEATSEPAQAIWFSRVHSDDAQSLQNAINEHLQGATAALEHEYRIKHEDGSYRWIKCRGSAVRDPQGIPLRVVGLQTDITVDKEAAEKLRRSAFHDELTGLPNRAQFLEQLQQSLAFTQRYPGISFAVLWLDLDHFKVVNNSLGGEMGDRLLVATAQRLRSYLSAENTLARIGGDEFIILLQQVRDINDATRTADRLQQLLALPFNLDGREVFTAVSIGIVLSSLLYKEAEHMMRDADTAMHRAKASGRSRYQVFDAAMRVRLLERLQLENDLRRAIALASSESGGRQELCLYYQPIVRLTTGQITGFEALVRWQHPEQGMISPVRFIPMAEETGLIIQLGWWVLREACRQMHQWHIQFADTPPMIMSVNLSSRQFAMSGLTEQIRQILEQTELNANYLKLELTESMVMENASAVVAVLRQIRSLGIQLAIDDFGTGYSSLSYLPRFPINTLKIDRSFVSKIGASNDGLEIIRTILSLAHNLNMDVTAEGVETADQSAQLRSLNCEYGQGYFFAKPLDGEAASRILQQKLNKPFAE